ncbi:DUF2752 domain-containing protein [Gemelliphila palaticanis]|uniref:DUF2752 domain-containing protein n=1 Tax=Gemelliphila palaticanis TaxID=81950 RepID=A0ABX2SX05_9BACL|nr:DUF2752 domain-containing protein [Gemella palaticanis]NYS46658.1 DUF2752 domain-containing protein [Gemella palaticanis]
MKNYFLIICDYHKVNLKLYIILILAIYSIYFFNLKTPISYILGDCWYWSKGLTRASVAIFKGDFSLAFKENPLIYVIMVFLIYYIFVEPIRYKKFKN